MPALIDFRLPFDETLFAALNRYRADWLDALFIAASSKPFGAAFGLALALLLLHRLRRRAFPALVQLALAVGATDLFGARVLKPLLARERPCFALPAEAVRMLAPAGNVGSLPSLHAANAFAAATLVALLVPRAGWVTFPLALLIGLSRVGVGVHWPSDVLAGGLWGAGLACVVQALWRWLRPDVRNSPTLILTSANEI